MIESIGVFIGITLGFMGCCAVLAGHALGANWRPLWQVFPYALLLGLADRFIAFALFGGTLLSLPYYVTDCAMLTAIALAAYRMTQARRMADQYPWLYERAGLFDWRERAGQSESREGAGQSESREGAGQSEPRAKGSRHS